jgi:transposase-like protein
MRKSLSKKSEKVIREVIEGGRLFENPLSAMAREGARMMLRVALEEELTEAIGRDLYERTEGARGSRNGYKQRTVKLSCGDITVQVPKARGLSFRSKVLAPYQTRMEELEEVIPLLYMNGLSTRRVKRSLRKVLGKKGLSHQTVSNISGKVVEEFNEWKRRDLSGLNVLYLVVDGIRVGVRAGTSEKEAVLVANAFLSNGRREVLGVALGNRESYLSWKGFFDDLRERGLKDPLLIVSDGCPGLLRAMEEVFPGVETQRCTKHKMDNVLEKVLKEDHEEVRDDLRRVFYGPTLEHSREAVALFERKWKKRYPSAVECLLMGIEKCQSYYRFPYTHWRRIRTSNGVERGFGEVRRRIRGMGRFKDEQRALATVWWLMKDCQQRWYGVGMTKEARKILARLRSEKALLAA